MILFRYLRKEIFSVLSGILLVLFLIFVCHLTIRYLRKVVTGKIASFVIIKLILLEMPRLVSLLLPAAFFMGIMLAYGRLYSDSEMTALHACGLSRKRLAKITFGIASIIFFLTFGLNSFIVPKIMAKRNAHINQAKSQLIMSTLLPGRFQQTPDKRFIYYIEDVSRNKKMLENIFIAQRSTSEETQEDTWTIWTAESGRQTVDEKTDDQFIETNFGYRYIGSPGLNHYQIFKYDLLGIRLEDGQGIKIHRPEQMRNSWELIKRILKKHSPVDIGELQWQLSVPISVLILTLIAIPLSVLRPRQGRYAKLLPAILLYAIYVNMIFVLRTWVKSSYIPAWPGMFWVHIAMLGLALLLWFPPHKWFQTIKIGRAK